MSDIESPTESPAAAPASPPPMPSAATPPAPPARAPSLLPLWLALVALTAFVLLVAWWLDGRLYATQAELAKRQGSAETAAIEARTIARQSADAARELTARVAVLESREQDLAAQRQALQQLYQDFAKSRDDAFLGQTAELIALAQQQVELTGSIAPLLSTLQSAAQRLQHAGSPRAQLVLHAVQLDINRLKSRVAPDIPAAAQRLDELAAMIDDLQLESSAAAPGKAAASAPAPAPVAGARGWLRHWGGAAWAQLRQLVSITRVDHPDILLMAPQQGEFLRANLKLRVLNARLDLLSRHAAGYRDDMRGIEEALRADFNPRQPRTRLALTLAQQAAQIDLSAQPAANLQSLVVLSTLGAGGN
jgi:uncharacterized protein HemX